MVGMRKTQQTEQTEQTQGICVCPVRLRMFCLQNNNLQRLLHLFSQYAALCWILIPAQILQIYTNLCVLFAGEYQHGECANAAYNSH